MSTLILRTRPVPQRRSSSFAGFTPAADVSRKADDAIVRVEIPGLDPEKDVAVELTGRRLVIRGERRDEQTREERGRTVRELRYGSFSRSFGVPRHVKADAISATYDAGVLSVRVAGAFANESPEAQRIAVTTAAEAQVAEAEAPAADAEQATPAEQPAA